MTLSDLQIMVGKAVTETIGGEYDNSLLSVSLAADAKFGDYSTNAAMVFAKQLNRQPRDIASDLAAAIKRQDSGIMRTEVAGPGFINIWVSDAAVVSAARESVKFQPDRFIGKVIVAEYSDPNPFKVLHAGHLYTTVVGDAISNLIEYAGGRVHKVNFGGDVGLHVARTMWAILHEFAGEHPEKLDKVAEYNRSEWMAACYVAGTQAYEDDEEAKVEIKRLNKEIYRIHEKDDHKSALAQIYWVCRKWSYDYFEAFYRQIGSSFERYYPESEVAPIGLATVNEQLAKGVFKISDGATVFEGEPYGLHTRVFITSQGLPTYEAKDLGVLMAKWRDYKFDYSIVITANDITEYMKVVLKSVEQFLPELAKRSIHLTHGNVKLAGGAKMSSRKGNFLRAVDVLDMAAEANAMANGHKDERVVLGAVKYSFLRQRIGADLVFIPEESVSLEGNSGPYLQYAHARARSIMAKSGKAITGQTIKVDANERILAFKIAEYADVVQRSVDELLPHHIATYLYELAQVFNRFYEISRVIGDPREQERLELVALYAEVLRMGLTLLGIEAPERL